MKTVDQERRGTGLGLVRKPREASRSATKVHRRSASPTRGCELHRTIALPLSKQRGP